MTRLKYVFGILAVVLAFAGIMTNSTSILALMYLIIGLLFLMIGFSIKKKERSIVTFTVFLLAGFNIIGSFYILLFEV